MMKIYNLRFESVQGERTIIGENSSQLKTLITNPVSYDDYAQVLSAAGTKYILCSFQDQTAFVNELHKLIPIVSQCCRGVK